MDLIGPFCQVVIALGIFNVWLFRFQKATPWRGGSAGNMKEEFRCYGLPSWSVGLVGGVKLGLSVVLIAGIWFPVLAKPAAIGIAVLMAAAVAMHVKVKDPFKKSWPALSLFLLSLVVVLA